MNRIFVVGTENDRRSSINGGRFNELKRYLKNVSDKTLSNHLKELERDNRDGESNE